MYYDLTATIDEKTSVFPGDPLFCRKVVQSLKPSHFALSEISLSNHIGTHIDFPAHVIDNGATSDDFNLDHLIGNGKVIDIGEVDIIDAKLLAKLEFKPHEIIFFKTKNSFLEKSGELFENYVHLTSDAAHFLVEKKIKIVGIDYISVDAFHEETLPVHQILLKEDILIVENLALKTVPAGNYRFYIAPLAIANMDGLPARVFAEYNLDDLLRASFKEAKEEIPRKINYKYATVLHEQEK